MDAGELARLPLFRRVSRNRLAEAMAAFIPCEIGAGEVLMREGEADRAMVIVLEGDLSIHIGANRMELTRLGRGELAGDMALFGAIDRRSATVISCKKSRILLLDAQGLQFLKMKRNPVVRILEEAALHTVARRLRETNRLIASVALGGEVQVDPAGTGVFGRLARMLRRGPSGDPPDAFTVLSSAPAFRTQPVAQLQRLAEQVSLHGVSPGTPIIREGEVGDYAFVVASGLVDVYHSTLRDTQERIARLREGALFGAASLVDEKPRAATCIAAEDTWLLRLPGELMLHRDEADPAEAAVFRRSMFNALSDQLRMANSHVEYLQGRLNGHSLDPRFN